MALIGCVAGVAWALWHAGGGPSWTEVANGWWPILALVCWWLIAPALSGRWPTGAGLARVADWLTIPIAAFAFRALGPRQRTIVGLACGGMLLLTCGIAALQHFGAWPEPAATNSPLVRSRSLIRSTKSSSIVSIQQQNPILALR